MKKRQKMSKKAIFIFLFWLICDLMVNHMEIQDFVELPCISSLWYTWNDTENVLENCENVLEKVLEKCLIFFLETCTQNWVSCWVLSLLWCHNGRDSLSNHQPHVCLLNRLFRRRSKKTSKLRVTGLCARNSPGTGEFPAQMASNAENVSIWWRHHVRGYTRSKNIDMNVIDMVC